MKKRRTNMKQHKKVRGLVSLLMALVMTVSVLCCTASAASNSSSALSNAISQAITNSAKATSNAILTNTLHPTPENPLQYSYTVKTTVSDPFGRAIYIDYEYPYTLWVDFYLSKAAYDAKQEPIASKHFHTDKNGQATIQYIDTFTKDPPATLYWRVRARTNTYFSPASGIVSPQIYVTD